MIKEKLKKTDPSDFADREQQDSMSQGSLRLAGPGWTCERWECSDLRSAASWWRDAERTDTLHIFWRLVCFLSVGSLRCLANIWGSCDPVLLWFQRVPDWGWDGGRGGVRGVRGEGDVSLQAAERLGAEPRRQIHSQIQRRGHGGGGGESQHGAGVPAPCPSVCLSTCPTHCRSLCLPACNNRNRVKAPTHRKPAVVWLIPPVNYWSVNFKGCQII